MVWIVQARIEGRSRRIVIARHGDIELAEFRRRARDMLARIRAGGNPADDIRREKADPAVAGVRRRVPAAFRAALEALRAARPCASISTAASCPPFGRMPLDRIGPEDVAAWFDAASKDRPGAANRAFEILRSMMNPGRGMGIGANAAPTPVSASSQEPEKVHRPVSRRGRAGAPRARARRPRSAQWPEAVAAIRLLALTGCRRSEVLNLRWRNVDGDALNLEDSKTGPRAVPLGDSRAGAHSRASRRSRPRRVPLPALRRRCEHIWPRNMLAHGLRRREARQPSPA